MRKKSSTDRENSEISFSPSVQKNIFEKSKIRFRKKFEEEKERERERERERVRERERRAARNGTERNGTEVVKWSSACE